MFVINVLLKSFLKIYNILSTDAGFDPKFELHLTLPNGNVIPNFKFILMLEIGEVRAI